MDFMAKSTISMAMFNSKLLNYQRVWGLGWAKNGGQSLGCYKPIMSGVGLDMKCWFWGRIMEIGVNALYEKHMKKCVSPLSWEVEVRKRTQTRKPSGILSPAIYTYGKA